jgi:Arc/MetJ family transcription regulator
MADLYAEQLASLDTLIARAMREPYVSNDEICYLSAARKAVRYAVDRARLRVAGDGGYRRVEER